MNSLEYLTSSRGLQSDIQLILQKLDLVLNKEKEMVDQVSDVDNALAQADAEIANVAQNEQAELSLAQQLEADVQALAGKVSPDLTPEVNHILAQIQSLHGVASNQATVEQDEVAADTAAGGSEVTPTPNA